MSETVDVAWHADSDADAALRDHVAAVVGVERAHVRVGRLCPRCGSASHGRPWADHDVHVSLARSGPHLVTAVSRVPVGVDVESVAAVGRAWPDLGVRTPTGTLQEQAALWCRIEAVAKLTGRGLSAPAYDVWLDAYDVRDLAAPESYVAAIATYRRAGDPDSGGGAAQSTGSDGSSGR